MGSSSTPTPASSSTIGVHSAPSSGVSPSKVVGNIALIAIMVFAAVEAANLLQFQAMSEFLAEVLGLGGRVLFGGAIIAAGVIIANVVAKFLDSSTGGADGFAIALSVAIGLSFMDVADEIIILAFGLILGSAAVAAALAFGMGGREQAGKWLARLSDKAEQKAQEQKVQQAVSPSSYTPPPAE
jgi:hypothetical protein